MPGVCLDRVNQKIVYVWQAGGRNGRGWTARRTGTLGADWVDTRPVRRRRRESERPHSTAGEPRWPSSGLFSNILDAWRATPYGLGAWGNRILGTRSVLDHHDDRVELDCSKACCVKLMNLWNR